eukprot:262347-Chlamydomonas_euryale.AAC.4
MHPHTPSHAPTYPPTHSPIRLATHTPMHACTHPCRRPPASPISQVMGASSSAVQVEAGGSRLELYNTEITQCGNGDDVVPRDLGAIDVQVWSRDGGVDGLGRASRVYPTA